MISYITSIKIRIKLIKYNKLLTKNKFYLNFNNLLDANSQIGENHFSLNGKKLAKREINIILILKIGFVTQWMS